MPLRIMICCRASLPLNSGSFLFEAGEINTAFGELLPQNVEHLLELKIGLARHGNDLFFELILRARALEIKPVADLAIGLVDTVAGLVSIKVTYDIKRRHLWFPAGSVITS